MILKLTIIIGTSRLGIYLYPRERTSNSLVISTKFLEARHSSSRLSIFLLTAVQVRVWLASHSQASLCSFSMKSSMWLLKRQGFWLELRSSGLLHKVMVLRTDKAELNISSKAVQIWSS